jgi:hypothetical protein
MTPRSKRKYLALGAFVVVFVVFGAAWILGLKLVAPANHAIALPAAFSAQSVAIPGVGHAIAGWWVDKGEN